jgi:polyribonucleotide nucleotidyltransferase
VGVSASTTLNIQVPSTMAGTIIGKRGSVIRNLRDRSGAVIHIAEADGGQDFRVVTVTGNKTQNDSAAALIYEIIQAATTERAQHDGGAPPNPYAANNPRY